MIPLLIVFIIATLAGYKVISEVPSLLHTPLMSGMNALSGITVIGALLVTGEAVSRGSVILGSAAVVLATVNIVAGFVVTHRMLRMFRSHDKGSKEARER